MAKSGVLRNAVRADPRADDRETTAMLPRRAFAGKWQDVCLFSEWNGDFVERVAVEGASVFR